ncbi:MAG: helix-turn-helix domain-containing protein [Marmoricola sp.]
MIHASTPGHSGTAGQPHHDAASVMPRNDDALLTIGEVAAMVRAPVATLRYWRHIGTGPHSFRVGRGVRYWRTDVTSWLNSQEQSELQLHAGHSPR